MHDSEYHPWSELAGCVNRTRFVGGRLPRLDVNHYYYYSDSQYSYMSRNIVFICLDSVRKDVFDEVAVRTQRLADVSFDNCRAASSWSAPSHASMISGKLPNEHRVTTHSRSFDSLSLENTIFDGLDEYRTVGISGNIFAGPTYNFDDYFDSFFVLNRETRFPRALSAYSDDYEMSLSGVSSYILDSMRDDRTIKSALNGFITFLNQVTDIPLWAFDQGAKPGLRIAKEELREIKAPAFIFLNLMEGHIPYRSGRYLGTDFHDVPSGWSSDKKGVWELFQEDYDEQYWNRRNQLYRATVEYLDRHISKFVRSVGEETTVIITADHGDNLGTEVDNGLANHKSSLTEGVLHVPCYIINAPDINEQTEEYLSHLNFPTLIKGIRKDHIPNLTSDQIPAELGGMSAGPDPENDYEYYDRAIRCVYNKDEKILWDSLGNCVEYRISSNNMNNQQYSASLDQPPSWATDHFGSSIVEYKSNIIERDDEINIDVSTEERLEELGYL